MPKNLIESRRDCATCHLEWSTEFEQPQAPLLIDKPAKPQAAQEDTCLGCHDGSVGDSRKIVWREHSHKVGMKPPAEMKIPPGLPLEDGKITCRTCHTAHAVPGTEDDLGGTFFLRVDNSQSQLCQLCHGDKSGGPQHGSHPVGPMTVGLPDKLKNAGAKSGPKGQELICQSCHGAHGSKADKLLVMSTSESQLCVSCHEKIKPGMWREGAPHDHPQNPPLETDAQRQAIKDMGTHIGTGDRLVCLSCHKLHESPSPRKLLADTLKDSKLCLRCHPDRADMVASQHDLRKTAPAEKNRLGQTPDDSGPCGACHSFHQYARDRAPAKGDPTGVCTTCHDKGHVAEKKGETFAFDHPSAVPKDKLPRDLKLAVMTDELDPAKVDVACLTCHDPHKAKTTKFLRNKPDDLCGTCHTEAKTLAGKHDFTDRPELKNAQGKTAAETGKCGFCHSVHKATSNLVMWNGTKDSPQRPEQLCVQCHKTGGMAKDHPAPPFSHPMGPQPNATTRPAMAALPLFDEAGHRSATGNVACASCHNPHSDSTKSALLLRVTGSTSALCVQCHSEKKTLAGSTHDASGNPKAWPAAAQSVNHDMCMTCHRAHSNDQQRKLWAMTPAPAAAPADG
ncbi:MAG TPA: cytochrome c3 family protein, partial [Tepidisphaeraceae bacterium]|nr:cytochrome c3 family protein [Tepidisphaeraceae bacterium]